MKIRLAFSFVLCIFALVIGGAVSNLIQPKDSVNSRRLLTVKEAEQILGEPACISDSAITIINGYSGYKCAYSAKEKSKEKTGNVYYMLEIYENKDSAHSKYDRTRISNERNGINIIDDLGEEAYFHSDGKNFLFIMARKQNALLSMKVNKITPKTSVEMFNAVARKIIDEQPN